MSEHDETMEPETITINEEETTERRWTDEFVVAGEELWDTVKQLVHETNVRRIVIKNEARSVHLQVPLALGVAGIALLPVYSAVALIAALVTDCKILVERVEKAPETVAATE